MWTPLRSALRFVATVSDYTRAVEEIDTIAGSPPGSRSTRGPLLFTIAMLLAASCTEPPVAPPHVFVGTFVLRSIDGQPIPILEVSAPAYHVTIVADTIVSDGRGRYTRRDVVEIDSLGASHSETRSTLDSGMYVARAGGDTIEFPYPCPTNAVCSPPPFAVLEPTGDMLFVHAVLLKDEWRYAHVR
jgi:hypothetical protein